MSDDPTIPGHDDADDLRPDIVQAVEARSEAIARGKGGKEPAMTTDTALPDGVNGTGGAGGNVRNQNDDAQ